MVRAQVGGAIYWAALAMTLALAACAFVLSFDALRSLAITLGLPTSILWLWPCAIDVAIAQATLCLLSLSRRLAAPSVGRHDTHRSHNLFCETILSGHGEGSRVTAASATPHSDAARAALSDGDGASETTAPAPETTAVDEAAVRRWSPTAESLVREGVTSKDPEVVAAILAQREAGMPPSSIGRTHRVHHTTVARILSAVDSLTG